MRWELSDEQADFRSVLADWLARTCPPHTLRGWLDSGDHTSFVERFRDAGWLGVGAPESIGGEGGGLIELALVAEELGRCAAPDAAWLGSVLGLGALAALPETAKQLWADGLVTVLACPADAPPGVGTGAADPPSAGPDVSGPPGARPDVVVGRGRLTGRCPAVLGAATAHRLLVPAVGGLYLVDADAVGVDRRARALTDRSRSLADVELDGVRATPVPAPVEEVVAEAGLRAGVLVAADALGVLRRMLDMTVEQALGRRQFGVAVGSFQAVKHAAAEMLVTLEAARSIVYLAAASVQAGHPDATLHAAAAKAQVCADVAAAADTALTLHGAIGYTWEHDLQIFYKRAKLDAALFGSAAAWNERIAAELPLLPTA